MPDPVVPAMSAWGPSRARSISTTPSAATPIAAVGRRIPARGSPGSGDGDGVVDRPAPVSLAERAQRQRGRQGDLRRGRILRVVQRRQSPGDPGRRRRGDAGDVHPSRPRRRRGLRPPPGEADRADLQGAAAERRHDIVGGHLDEDRGRGTGAQVTPQGPGSQGEQFGSVGRDEDVTVVAGVELAEHGGEALGIVGRDDHRGAVRRRGVREPPAPVPLPPVRRRRRSAASRPDRPTWRAARSATARRPGPPPR